MTAFSVTQSVQGVRWASRIEDAEAERYVQALVQQYYVPDIVARVIIGRGVAIEEAQDYLHPTLKSLLPDPSHLLDVDKAVARLVKAIHVGEKIAIFGDYDVDGATSSALFKRYFAALGQELFIYIPDRMKEGYGPNLAAFESLKAQGASVIVTVDCGTVSFDPIEAIGTQGVDVIVVDHHMAQARLPSACAVVNPNRIDQDSPCGHMAAVGVSFLVLVALNRALREEGYFNDRPEPNLMQWLDLVALGTVCDVVALKGVNRALVSQGLKVMAGRSNAGIRALCDIARMDEPPSTYHAGFLIGPRINAGGRVGESELGSTILSSDDAMLCAQIAVKLDQYNAERQAIEACVLEQAMEQADKQANQSIIMVASDGWHEGVIGIVAGRLKEAFQRPAAVISIRDGVGKASARSVSGADIGATVASAKEEGLLLAGGGHAMAAGFSFSIDKLEALHGYLDKRLSPAVSQYALKRNWLYDALVSVDGLTLHLLDQLDQAGPFGMGNPGPKLVIANARVIRCDRMKDKHLRVIVSDASSRRSTTAVTFNSVGTAMGDLLESSVGKQLHLAGTAKRNRWNGQESVQFMIDDVAAA